MQPSNSFPMAIQEWGERYVARAKRQLDGITTIFTLGPAGTNLGAAATEWFRRRGIAGNVVLYRTVEEAVNSLPLDESYALLTCAVYPELHNVVFNNLGKLAFVDSFIWPTHPMLLASRTGQPPKTVSTHPAPQGLVPPSATKAISTSNSQAAKDCAEGKTDGCITTLEAARAYGLKILKDYGPVPMVYTLHGRQVDAS
jgi:hypothetical protein